MKKNIQKSILSWVLVFCMVLPLLSSVIYTQAADSDLKDYDAMTMEQILASEESLTWVITGDSITHNAEWTAGVNSYGEWMEQYLGEIGRGDDAVVLSGWGGADTPDFRTTADGGAGDDPGMGLENFVTKYNPDVVTIKLGMNDRYKTTSKFVEYYKQMLDSLYKICEEEYNKIPKVILLSPTPLQSENIYDDTYHLTNDDAIEESTLRIRNAVEDIAEEYDLLFCDLRTAFLDAQAELGEDYAHTFFTDPSDGLHPNEAGQYCIFKALSNTLGIYDETMPIYQYAYEDLDYHALYADGTDVVTYTGDYANSGADWTTSVVENYTWAVLGGSQMFGYETDAVNRSLLRYIENAMRGSSGTASYRDIHMYNLATPGYDVADMVANYNTLVDERTYNVFMLYPELTDVYESNYVHSDDLVAAYKANVETLLANNSGKVKILWTPLASNNETINGYITEYADAIREIVADDTSILFFDANQFMNDNMDGKTSLLNNWFEDGAYVSPLCTVDVARAFYETMGLSNTGKAELSNHNLRYTSDMKVYKGPYVNDYIAADVTVDEANVSVDVSEIVTAYPNAELNIVVLPYKGAGNYNADIVDLDSVATVTKDGNVYSFAAPCANLNLAIYGTQGSVIYRYKDISLTVNTDATMPEISAEPLTEVCLDSLEVMSVPEIGFDKDTTEYSVELYAYQTYARVKATAKAGITITVNDEVIASGAMSNIIKVDDGDQITVTASGEVNGQAVSKTYTLNLAKNEYPDIIITEVMTDAYWQSGANDGYELVEIYNASGKDLNLLDYSIGYKKDYTYNAITTANGGEYPYYFTGNDQAFAGNATHTGIKELTKYSMYWKDQGYTEPTEVTFKADSTMVIWIKFSPQSTATARETYGASLTYDTLIAQLKESAGTYTLTTDIDGTETAVVPVEDQLVVAEYYTDAASAGLQTRSKNVATNRNWYMDAIGTDTGSNNIPTRGWLFILDDNATVAQNGTITEEGDNIISAAKYIRPGVTYSYSSVFSYNTDRGMSLVKNEGSIDYSLVGTGNTSDVMGYSNLTSFGAIEYWQKPTDSGDKTAPTVTNNTISQLASGVEGIISLDLADDTDVRYVEVYVRKAGEDAFTKVATKDLVLEAGVLNAGLSEDITSYTYTCSVGEVTGTVEYYVTVEDGNGNVTSEGTASAPCSITLVPKVVEEYLADDAKTYIGVEAPECAQKGYLFSGWYADEACTTTPIQKLEEATGTVYALFVVEDVLSIKAQISSNLGNDDKTDDATGSIRFVTTVDSLWYLKAGFKVSYDKDGDGVPTTITSANNKVYKKLYAVNMTSGTTLEYEPTEFSNASKYFKACTVVNVTEDYYSMDFTVTPFWVTPDGIEVEGVTAVKSINDGIYSEYEAEIDGSYYEELEEAIEVANADADATTIIVLNDAEVESQLSITTDITIQNLEREDITIYRGSGLTSADMFTVASGATLTIQGVDDKGSLVLDGRTASEAVAETGRDAANGSTGSLINNSGTVNLTNVTVQYVKKTVEKGDGGVVLNASGATVNVKDSVFDNNKTTRYGSVIYSNGGIAVENTVFTNNAGNNGGVICHHNASSTMTIDECDFEENAGYSGAAIWSNKTATITDTTFTNNTASWNGGAICTSGGTMDIENSTFANNTSAQNKGGAIYFDNSTTCNITDSKFVGNTAVANAGAVAVAGSSKATITGTTEKALFESNSVTGTSGVGGALYFGSGTLTVSGYTFNNNTSSTTGGAIQVQTAATVSDCTFNQNSAATNGGAIWASAKLTATDCAFNQNSASSASASLGGAIYVKSASTITDCTFTSNTVDYRGGAMYLDAAVDMTGCTFTSNTSAKEGGAICAYANANVTDCKFVENKSTGHRGAGIYMGGGKTVTFVGNDADMALFQSNTAKQGGAICVGSGTLKVTGYTFDKNSATEYTGGGAIKLNDASITATLEDCVFTRNSGQKAGAICADGNGNAQTVTITNCSFGGATSDLGNVSTGIDSYTNNGGSVIWAGTMVTLKLVGTDSAKAFISNNTSKSSVGAISVNGGAVEVNGYTFTGNTNAGDTSHDIYNNGSTITGDGNYVVYVVPTTEE